MVYVGTITKKNKNKKNAWSGRATLVGISRGKLEVTTGARSWAKGLENHDLGAVGLNLENYGLLKFSELALE